jgi:hypothetical protein
MNIVSMAMNYLTPAIVGRIASSLGIESRLAQMAISAALPTILGAIVGKSSTPSGLGQLTDLLKTQDSGMLSNLAGMIGGADQSKLVNAGSGALGTLLGNSALGTLAGAVGKFAGIGEAPTKGLLGMLAPVALGSIAQQQKASNLDGPGLARMLAGQKDNISAALPAGFGDMLKGTGLLDGIGSPSAPARPAAAQSSGPVVTPKVQQQGLPSWLTWGALLAALLAAWYLLGPGSGTRRAANVPTQIMHNNVNVAAQVNTLYEGLKTTLGGVRDAGTAQAALPRLQEGVRSLDSLQALAGTMPAATRGNLAALVASYLPQVAALTKTALDTPGVGAILKPVLDQILAKMTTLSK